jgi:hypothetical protein
MREQGGQVKKGVFTVRDNEQMCGKIQCGLAVLVDTNMSYIINIAFCVELT